MNRGELLTRLTVWLALCAYATGAGMWLVAQRRPRWLAGARRAWTCGCAFFLGHVACAFNYYHRWSHADAYQETARQTAAITGLHWGGGIFFNYLFAVAWVADLLWWWLAPESFLRRPARLAAVWHSFMFFMVFNGTIVFGRGPVRWLGALICAGLAVLWWKRRGLPRGEIAPTEIG
ncbi:MAG: hypothetical protein QOE70_77 [Chthoniobacter sp.]|jgi:hypothetical protein|nr:hypothetical protein [Chthoniobacter sp.]